MHAEQHGSQRRDRRIAQQEEQQDADERNVAQMQRKAGPMECRQIIVPAVAV